MTRQYKEIIYSVLLGIVWGAVGVILIGYIAAVAIPKEFILWFGNNQLANSSINFIYNFLAFGVISIVIGIIIGRLSKRWLLNSFICYVIYLLYMSVVVYGGEFLNPFSGLTYYDFPSVLLLPTCLLLSSYLSVRKS